MLPQRTSFSRPLIVLLLAAGLLFSFTAKKEKVYPFEKWTEAELAAANTAKDIAYLSEEEKLMIYYTNLARINPKLFGETYAQQYIDTSNKKSSYTTTLLNTLKKTAAMPALKVDSMLCVTAAGHAKTTGNTGTTGHSGKRARFAKVKSRFHLWGENCSYGYDKGIDIVMQLLIDQDVSNLGHRKNILNREFTHVGVGIDKHKIYRWTGVQNFAGKPVSS